MSKTAVVVPDKKRQSDNENKTRRQPPYHVVLWDDDEHTYSYVIRMLQKLFGFPQEKGYQLARDVDANGRVVCLTTTREHAELKQEQIHAFGRDNAITSCVGSMFATIEPAE